MPEAKRAISEIDAKFLEDLAETIAEKLADKVEDRLEKRFISSMGHGAWGFIKKGIAAVLLFLVAYGAGKGGIGQ